MNKFLFVFQFVDLKNDWFFVLFLLLNEQVWYVCTSNQWSSSSSTDWEYKASIDKHFLFTHFFFSSSQQCLIPFISFFFLSLSQKPQGIFIIHVGIVDQKKLKTTENKNIDKSISMYIEKRERGKSLMQFKYCRQLLSKTNDKYYLINVLYVYV
jgi:hypothetical protein